jgi:hypothetical protein
MKSTNVKLCKMKTQFADGSYKISSSIIENEKTVLMEKITNDDEYAQLL